MDHTVVPATSSHLRFGAKVATRGRWPPYTVTQLCHKLTYQHFFSKHFVTIKVSQKIMKTQIIFIVISRVCSSQGWQQILMVWDLPSAFMTMSPWLGWPTNTGASIVSRTNQYKMCQVCHNAVKSIKIVTLFASKLMTSGIFVASYDIILNPT